MNPLRTRAGEYFAMRRSLGRLDLAKNIAHPSGATVNDVVLAAIAGGLRELLLSRGEPIGELVLRAMVPVSLHGKQAGHASGNQDGWMVVPLPIGEPSHVRRPLGIGVLSYAGQLNLTAVADRDGCPDVDVFAVADGTTSRQAEHQIMTRMQRELSGSDQGLHHCALRIHRHICITARSAYGQ